MTLPPPLARVKSGPGIAEMKALLIDFDGVLRLWDWDALAVIEQQAHLPVGAITGAAFSSELLVPAILGKVTDEEWRRLTLERLLRDFPRSNAESGIALWSKATGQINRPVLEAVRDCRILSTVVLVTNGTTRLQRDLGACLFSRSGIGNKGIANVGFRETGSR